MSKANRLPTTLKVLLVLVLGFSAIFLESCSSLESYYGYDLSDTSIKFCDVTTIKNLRITSVYWLGKDAERTISRGSKFKIQIGTYLMVGQYYSEKNGKRFEIKAPLSFDPAGKYLITVDDTENPTRLELEFISAEE